jgi:hypothetical protein
MALRNHVLHPVHLKKRLGLSRLSYFNFSNLPKTRNLRLDVGKKEFGEVNEVMFQGV